MSEGKNDALKTKELTWSREPCSSCIGQGYKVSPAELCQILDDFSDKLDL